MDASANIARAIDTSVPAIELDHVSKRYPLYSSARQRLRDLLLGRSSGEHWALRDVNLRIAPGETVGIIGGNGAGKSTLLGIVAGATAPTRGSVRANGRIGALLELGAGFHPDWTGRQNAEFHMRLRGASRRRALALVDEIEAFADVGDYFDQPLRTSSSGMAMRIAFAAAVAIEPDIIVVDEALAVGDASFQHKCYRRLAEFQARGVTILLVTHRLDLIPQLCQRALLLADGAILFDGAPGPAIDLYVQRLLAATDYAVERGEAQELRTGSGEARIERMEVCAAPDGKPAEMAAGQLALEFELRFDAAIERPQLGFSLRTVENVLLYAANNEQMGHRLAPAAAGESRRARIDCPLPFSSGPIFVDASLWDGSCGEMRMLDARFSALKIEIRPTGAAQGIVDLKATIRALP
jgi:lipopolysaccharide transport system ATP-binding protein